MSAPIRESGTKEDTLIVGWDPLVYPTNGGS